MRIPPLPAASVRGRGESIGFSGARRVTWGDSRQSVIRATSGLSSAELLGAHLPHQRVERVVAAPLEMLALRALQEPVEITHPVVLGMLAHITAARIAVPVVLVSWSPVQVRKALWSAYRRSISARCDSVAHCEALQAKVLSQSHPYRRSSAYHHNLAGGLEHLNCLAGCEGGGSCGRRRAEVAEPAAGVELNCSPCGRRRAPGCRRTSTGTRRVDHVPHGDRVVDALGEGTGQAGETARIGRTGEERVAEQSAP